MADITASRPSSETAGDPAAVQSTPPFGGDAPDLFALAELLFFAYRDFINDPDSILGEFGFGRAHHRVLHFVNRHPGLRVADLLDILKITKQSLGRVLKELVDKGFIAQQAGRVDRRERLLYPTAQGRALADRLAAPQLERMARAMETLGEDGKAAVHRFLYQMITESGRTKVAELLNAEQGTEPPRGETS